MKKADAQTIAHGLADLGPTSSHKQAVAEKVADALDLPKSYPKSEFISDATADPLSPQERQQAEAAFQENPSEPSTEEAEHLGESAREGRGHPGSGVA
jgi:hypothetical protein